MSLPMQRQKKRESFREISWRRSRSFGRDLLKIAETSVKVRRSTSRCDCRRKKKNFRRRNIFEKEENFSKYRKCQKALEDWTADTLEKIRRSVRRYAGSQRRIGPKRRKNLVDWTADERRRIEHLPLRLPRWLWIRHVGKKEKIESPLRSA